MHHYKPMPQILADCKYVTINQSQFNFISLLAKQCKHSPLFKSVFNTVELSKELFSENIKEKLCTV